MNLIKKAYYKAHLVFKYGFHPGKWEYQLAWLWNIFRGRVLYSVLGIGGPVFKSIDFATNYTCNFNCEHCYAKQLTQRGKELMTVEDYADTVKQAMALGARGFAFQGGEIFLRKDWRDVLRAAQPHRNHITITTNSTLLNDNIIRDMSEIGVDTVCFSMDSGIAEEHDVFRKHPGCFNYMMEMMKLVEKHKMKVAINITMWKGNLYTEGFRKALDFAHEKKYLIATILGRPLGNWEGKDEVLLNDEDMAYYYKLRKNYPTVVRDLDSNYGKWGCLAVKEQFYITPYGDVFGCPFMHISFGNIKEEPLKTIRDRALKNFKCLRDDGRECLTGRDMEFMKVYSEILQENLIEKGQYPTWNDLKNKGIR